MKKAENLSYPADSIQEDWRTDSSIVPGKEDLSYGRQVRSAASKPDRLVPCPEAYRARRMVNKY